MFPAGVKLTVLLVPAGVKLTVPLVGTPTGHATVPAGVKDTVPLVPAGVKLTVPFVGTPAGHALANVPAVNAPLWPSAGTVKLGAVALQAVVEPVPAAMLVAAQFPLVLVATLTKVPSPGTPLIVGTPAGHEIVSAGTVPEFPVNVSAGTVPALPLNVGTPAGQEIVSAGTVPEVPVNVCAGTVPDEPVKVGAATVPAGV